MMRLKSIRILAPFILFSCHGPKEVTQKPTPAEDRFNTRLPDSLSRKQAAGIDYVIYGTKPVNWSLDMDAEHQFRFRAADGRALDVVAVRGNEEAGLNHFISGDMDIRIYKDKCADKTSLKAEVTIQQTLYTGCGSSLYDYRLTDVWKLAEIDHQPISKKMRDRNPFISINVASLQVSGNDGCNSFSGSFTLFGNKIKTNAFTSTRMACVDPGINTNWVTKLSAASFDYRVEGNMLLLYLPDDSSLKFTKQ